MFGRLDLIVEGVKSIQIVNIVKVHQEIMIHYFGLGEPHSVRIIPR